MLESQVLFFCLNLTPYTHNLFTLASHRSLFTLSQPHTLSFFSLHSANYFAITNTSICLLSIFNICSALYTFFYFLCLSFELLYPFTEFKIRYAYCHITKQTICIVSVIMISTVELGIDIDIDIGIDIENVISIHIHIRFLFRSLSSFVHLNAESPILSYICAFSFLSIIN